MGTRNPLEKKQQNNGNGLYPPGFLRMVVLPALSRPSTKIRALQRLRSSEAVIQGGYITVVGNYIHAKQYIYIYLMMMMMMMMMMLMRPHLKKLKQT